MKKKIVLVSLILLIGGLFVLTGCDTKKNTTSDEIESKINGKSYMVNGVSIKLDKEDSNNKIKYETSSSFNKDSSTTGYVYTIYKNKSEDKYDFSNITFRLDVSVDKMNTQSKIENVKASINSKDNLKNIKQEQKVINDTTWDYFTYDNYYEDDANFEQHLYITEKKIDKYYYVYKIYFSFAKDIDEFEEAFMNSITFE